MMRKWNLIPLVVLLTFLQCLAPLLHAHAGGLHSGPIGHVHLAALSIAPPAGQTELRADHSDAPSLSVPAEFRRDPAVSGGEPAALPVALPYPSLPVAFSAPLVQLHLAPLPFRLSTPPAQAPPLQL